MLRGQKVEVEVGHNWIPATVIRWLSRAPGETVKRIEVRLADESVLSNWPLAAVRDTRTHWRDNDPLFCGETIHHQSSDQRDDITCRACIDAFDAFNQGGTAA